MGAALVWRAGSVDLYLNTIEINMDRLTSIGKALDEISWEWLSDNYPVLATAVEEAVKLNVTPDEVRRYVMWHVDRYEIALRCEQAARHLRGDDGS